MRIGPVVISIGTTDAQWEDDLAIIRAMKPDLIKIPSETAFTPYPHRIRALVDELKPKIVVLSLGMEAIDGGWASVQQLVGQQVATLRAHPNIEFVIELGNEGEYHDPPWGAAKDQWGYRYQILDLTTKLRAWGPLNMRVGASMPVFLDAARDVVLSRDEHGCIADDLDYLCTHYYGHEFIGDGAGNGKDHNAAWGPIYEMLKGTACKILFTEIGIDSPSSTLETKSLRLLKWLEEQPEQVAGAAIWCVGPWRNMGLDIPGAAVYGNRRRQSAPTPPPTKEQSMPRVIVSAGHERIGSITAEKIGQPSANNLRGSTGALGREAEWTGPWANELVERLRSAGIDAIRTGAIYDANAYGRDADLVISGHCDGVGNQHAAQYCMASTVHSGPSTPAADLRADKFIAIWRDVYPQLCDLPLNGNITTNMTQYYGGWYRTPNTPMVLIEHKILGAGGIWRTDGPTPAQAAAADAAAVLRYFGMEDRAEYLAVKDKDHRETGTGLHLSHGFKTLYEEAERAPNQLGIRLLGAGPITEPFDMTFSDNPEQIYTVQLLERGGGFMYEGGQEEPWRNHALTTWQAVEAWNYALANKKIPEHLIPKHLR